MRADKMGKFTFFFPMYEISGGQCFESIYTKLFYFHVKILL